MTKLFRQLADKVLWKVAELAAKFPDNDYFSAYTITNGTTNYLTRVKFPRVFGMRIMLHKIWRADSDREMHNHPWDKAFSFILLGSYMEERLDLTSEMIYDAIYSNRPGSVGFSLVKPEPVRITSHVKWFNEIRKEDFHKITSIDGPLWTIFVAGKRTPDKDGNDWGFLNEETRELIPWQKYIAKTGSTKT